jgi:serine/threonine-protein kinase
MFDAERVRDIFDRVVQLAPDDRAEFLASACAGNQELRREIERLLSAYEDLGDIFEDDEPEPTTIGAYRIVRELGRGGGGTVYLAARDDDEFKKAVAIKVLTPGPKSAELVRRFRGERQILASIEHPYIAKLLDGGSTADGRPYLVMEYIDGMPVDAHCEAKRLSTVDRLALFCKICEAVQFAHQNLVIHRDIKPGNILVTADGVPKLLDFGIAKLVDPTAFAVTMEVTQADARPMTPEFASPEQIRGEPITTASDVYSLGVLLYRLLTGQRPYRRTGELSELAKAICEEDPPRPSVAIGGEEPDTQERLRRQLRGDLDNIVLKAIRKEPDRRYVSAEQLADDIQRHLTHLPVRAAADTVRYRVTKFVRRHRAGVATAAAFVMFVVIAAVMFAVQASVIAKERDRAEREAARAGAINDFLLRTLGAASPHAGTGRDVTLAAALSAAAATARHSFAGQPEIEAGLLNVVGMTFVELGRYEEAQGLLDRALVLRTEALGRNHLDVAESLESKATLLRWRGEFAESERLYREALRIVRGAPGDRRERTVQVLQGLGMNYSQRGDEKGALTVYTEALQLASAASIGERTRAELLGSAGVTHRRLENYAQAERLYREALEIQRRLLGPKHAEVGTLLNNLAALMNASGRYAEAEAINREALSVRQEALGRGHPLVANSMLNLAVALENRGDMASAAALYEEAASIVRAALGPDHPRFAAILRNWGVLLANQGKPADAVPLLREALRIRRLAFKEDNREVADAMTALASALRHAGALSESEVLTRQALALNIRLLGAESEAVAVSRKDLAALLCAEGKVAPALELLEEASGFFARHPDVEPRSAAIVRREYGACLTKARRYPEAEAALLDAHSKLASLGPNHRIAKEAANRLAELYTAWGKPAEASRFAKP